VRPRRQAGASARPLNFIVRAPIAKLQMPYLAIAYALVVALIVVLMSGGRPVDVLINWAWLVTPQVLTIVMAGAFPSLRRPFATVALWSLTVLLVLTQLAAWLSSGEHLMLWVIYPPMGVAVMLAVGVYFWVISRRSNNRRRGP
jgi:hypothetical protein